MAHEWIDGYVGEENEQIWMGEKRDGQREGRMGGRMDGWMDGYSKEKNDHKLMGV